MLASVPQQEKGSKKKRKRCGECPGCQRKDNCGDCAPCRNDKSHQICKVRRCEKLTEKKIRKAAVSTGKTRLRSFHGLLPLTCSLSNLPPRVAYRVQQKGSS